MNRTHVDYAAALLLVHLTEGGTGGEECTVEVYREERLPLGKLEFDEGRHDLDARIVDQNIKPPKAATVFSVPAST